MAGSAKYMRIRLWRTTTRMIFLLILITGVSFVNKTWLSEPNLSIGRVTDMLHYDADEDKLFRKVDVSMADILGIYIGLQFLEAFIDVALHGTRFIPEAYRRGRRRGRRLEEEARLLEQEEVSEDQGL